MSAFSKYIFEMVRNAPNSQTRRAATRDALAHRHIEREDGGHDSSQFVSVTPLEVTWRAKEKGDTLEMGRNHWWGDGGTGGGWRGCLQVVGLE